MDKKPYYLDGVERLNKLRRICPDFDDVCSNFQFGTFRIEKPDLAIACRIFQNTYCGEPGELLHELDSNAHINEHYTNYERSAYGFNMHNVCCYLIDFFSVSGEIECGAAVLRWMHENADCVLSEGEVLRL